MRKYQHLDRLIKHNSGVGNKTEFAELVMADLKQSNCFIYGETKDEGRVQLAELKTQLETIKFYNGLFQQHIEFSVEGKIINDQYPAITYQVKGAILLFYGRCSTIPQVCGVDLYLDKSYTGKVGDCVKQKLTIPVSKLYRLVK